MNESLTSVDLPIEENSVYQFLLRNKDKTKEEYDRDISLNQFLDAVDYNDIPGLINTLDDDTQEDLYQMLVMKLNSVVRGISPTDYAENSYASNEELPAELNTILEANQLDFNPFEDFKMAQEDLDDCTAEERAEFEKNGNQIVFETDQSSPTSNEKYLQLANEVEERMENIDEEISIKNQSILDNKTMLTKEKMKKILRENAIRKLGKQTTENEISKEIIFQAKKMKETVNKTMIDLTEKEKEFFKCVAENDNKAVRLFHEIFPGLNSKIPTNDSIQTQMIKMFQLERELIQQADKDHVIDTHQMERHYIDKISGEKMWELHKENPDFYTGERLGSLFGVTRERAWAELIMREHKETEEDMKKLLNRFREGKPHFALVYKEKIGCIYYIVYYMYCLEL